MNWSYGVMTVPERRELLLDTLCSLHTAGFDSPRLFVDGSVGVLPHATTARMPRIRLAANWHLSLLELWLRDPVADRFALFQDDLLAARGLREYLESCPYPEQSYLNLFTFQTEQALSPGKGWYLSNQRGRGALALVFDQDACAAILSNRSFVLRHQHRTKGHQNVDGGISGSMCEMGYKEWVHDPSLVKHTGLVSTVGHFPYPDVKYTGEVR